MMLKKILKKISVLPVYRGRYNDGNHDLVKGLPQAKKISERQKKEILDFWKPYLNDYWSKKAFDIRWFDIYNKTNVFGYELKYYIPDSYYYAIVDTFFSDARRTKVLDDKNLYDLYFHDVHQPKTIVRKNDGLFLDDSYSILTKDEAIGRCLANGRVIVKSSVNSCGGHGVKLWDGNRMEQKDLDALFERFPSFVVQDVIKQHPVLASLNDSSVNTLRLVTLIFKEKVHLVTSVIIMGGKGAETNHLHSGGLVCGITSSGQLKNVAFDGKLNQYEVHPNGMRFSDVVVPGYGKCVELVKKLAPRFSRLSKLTAWDLTIDCNSEPVLIETNLSWGGSVQIAGGPVFGNMTKEVLDYLKDRGTMLSR